MAAENLLSLGRMANNPQWQARALMVKGFVSLLQTNSAEAIKLLEQAKDMDPKHWPTYYNLAAAYAEPEKTNALSPQQFNKCIDNLRVFQSMSEWNSDTVITQLAHDQDGVFPKLFSALTNKEINLAWQTNQLIWKDALKARLQENKPVTP